MGSILNKVLAILVILLLTIVLGVFTGIKNSSDYQISEFDFEEINDDIFVYRDAHFVPTIVASNNFDLFFAQGYEMARDRLWQLEFFRSLANGELSKLTGAEQIPADKYLKTLSMKIAAENTFQRMQDEDPIYFEAIDAFVQGINKYIELHSNNLPTEFTVLGVEPKEWTAIDTLAIQGVLSRTLSIGALEREMMRNELAIQFGPEKAEEMFPIQSPEARDYYLGLNDTTLAPIESLNFDHQEYLQFHDYEVLAGSNNWVVAPERSSTGNPLIANDPHLDLTTPSIWWQVNLRSPTFKVQGFALPGVPGIIAGHNEHMSWGVTNTGLDAADVFYFKTNDQNQYFYNNTWTEFTTVEHSIGSDGDQITYEVKYTEYGPVLDPNLFSIPSDVSDHVYALRWTYLENYDRDLSVKALLDYNTAENVNEFVAALEYFGVPGQNFVFASVDGDIGYQFTGLMPIRNVPGSGIIPQNGSNPLFGWNGTVEFTDQLRVINPSQGYFYTANEKVDTSDEFYISDNFALPYRANRINELLSSDESVSIQDMKNIQDDSYNYYAKVILDEIMSEITNSDYSGNSDRFENVLEILQGWNLRMQRDSIGATIFAIFRIFLEEGTFKDDFNNPEIISYDDYSSRADYGISSIIDDQDNEWFDDITTSQIETRGDMVEKAFGRTIDYLYDEVSRFTSNWEWGDLHEVVFQHAFGDSAFGVFNEGNIGSDGSEHTIKAAGGTPGYEDGEIDFIQTHGSSFRYVAEVSSSWSNVFGIIPPGQSEHFFVGQRGNTTEDWVKGITYRWNFYEEFDRDPDFTYVKI